MQDNERLVNMALEKRLIKELERDWISLIYLIQNCHINCKITDNMFCKWVNNKEFSI